jgi:hypothetical protein
MPEGRKRVFLSVPREGGSGSGAPQVVVEFSDSWQHRYDASKTRMQVSSADGRLSLSREQTLTLARWLHEWLGPAGEDVL